MDADDPILDDAPRSPAPSAPVEECYYGPCAGGGYHGGWETCERCAPLHALPSTEAVLAAVEGARRTDYTGRIVWQVPYPQRESVDVETLATHGVTVEVNEGLELGRSVLSFPDARITPEVSHDV